MKVFAASIAACSDQTGERITNHIAVLLIYESIEEARAEAERIAFLRWKEKDGWYGHGASIAVANEGFYSAYEDNRSQGLLVPDNGSYNFYFDQLDAEILT